jgi:hypothetical protein
VPITSLSPKTQSSTVVLTSTGSADLVAAAVPYGMYTGSAGFLNGAAEQVAYTYKKLGGDVLDIELTAGNVYASYEEAVLEYSYIVNIHQSKNVLSDLLGASTGSYDHHGKISDSAESLSGSNVSLTFPRVRFTYEQKIASTMASRTAVNGDINEYSASFATSAFNQDYDLQKVIYDLSTSDSSLRFYNKVGNKRVTIKKVYFKTPHSMWRFFGYYGGINTVGNLSSYGMYADDTTFQLIPAWHNKLQAMQFEDNIWTRVSHYSYELKNNWIRLYPKPSEVSPDRIWFTFTVETDPWVEDSVDRTNMIHGVNNMSTAPFENIPYNKINSIGKQWIRRFALALSKETLGQVRSKFASVPIPGDQVQLNGAALISEGREEQDKLREELKTTLDELTYAKLLEQDAVKAEAAGKIQEKIPLPIIVG